MGCAIPEAKRRTFKKAIAACPSVFDEQAAIVSGRI